MLDKCLCIFRAANVSSVGTFRFACFSLHFKIKCSDIKFVVKWPYCHEECLCQAEDKIQIVIIDNSEVYLRSLILYLYVYISSIQVIK